MQTDWAPDDPNTAAPQTGSLATAGATTNTGAHATTRDAPCRLCDGSVRARQPAHDKYCVDCCTDAREGLFIDHGFDEPWSEAVVWALKMLAEIEFGGPPAKEQLNELPAPGPQCDLLMLCRMLTARSSMTTLGATRKSYSWTDWLAKADLLTNGLRTGRGVTVMAKDGHLCRSLLERQIDDFFYENGIEHVTEPAYPFDPELNLYGSRADWKLPDGTLVEAWGFPNDVAYMEKAERKIKLAHKHQIPVLTVTAADTANLTSIFGRWLGPENVRPVAGLPPRPWAPTPPAVEVKGPNNGKNAANTKARTQRLERCAQALNLQATGATRRQIAQQLSVSEELIGMLLRDGKFYANPTADPVRLAAARDAATAQKSGRTRAQFRAEFELSQKKADECWKDADVLFNEEDSTQDHHQDGQGTAL